MTSVSFTKNLLSFMKRTGHKPGPLCIGQPMTELAVCQHCNRLFYLVDYVFITHRGHVICSVGDKVAINDIKQYLCPRLEVLR